MGIFGINMGPATPAHVTTVARAAEAAGLESVWAGEHVVLPDPHVPPSPLPPKAPILDPLVALAWAGAVTTTVKLGTGIVILPQRNPVVLAKEVATLDQLSGGRAILGIGAGYLEPEFRAVGADFEGRGARTDEHLAALRSLWEDEHPSFDGPTVSFSGIDAQPRPLQRPLPVVVGGHSPAAFRRAVTSAQGWYGFFLRPDDVAKAMPHLGALEITVTPRDPVTRALLDDFAALGVHRIVALPGTSMGDLGGTTATALAAIDALASL